MVKGKKRSVAPGKKHRGRPDTVPSAAPNPFEQLYSRKKFDILGKRQKSAGKSALQARSQANQKVRFEAKGRFGIEMAAASGHVILRRPAAVVKQRLTPMAWLSCMTVDNVPSCVT